jgi:hypothetical protein
VTAHIVPYSVQSLLAVHPATLHHTGLYLHCIVLHCTVLQHILILQHCAVLCAQRHMSPSATSTIRDAVHILAITRLPGQLQQAQLTPASLNKFAWLRNDKRHIKCVYAYSVGSLRLTDTPSSPSTCRSYAVHDECAILARTTTRLLLLPLTAVCPGMHTGSNWQC